VSSLRRWAQTGSPWVWLTAGAVSVCMLMVIGVIGLIAARGFAHFWPQAVAVFSYTDGQGQQGRYMGELVDTEWVPADLVRADGFEVPAGEAHIERRLYKLGNRDVTGRDFRWFVVPGMSEPRSPAGATVVEREEWGNAYGFVSAVSERGETVASGAQAWPALERRLQRRHAIKNRIEEIEEHAIGEVNYAMEQLRLDERRLALEGRDTPERLQAIERERAALKARYEQLNVDLRALYERINRDSATLRLASGQSIEIPLAKIAYVHQPNAMSLLDKMGYYLHAITAFVTEDPREANTEGGIFPAIFGTVLMVLVMSVLVTPFGVIAAVYLREYATQGPVTRVIRIAVNNLAGVPSIVYGVFGLGFFVYFVGSNIDKWFYPAALPAPTFGTPGLLWSSLTLAILTMPVVIVATEEGLSRIPRAIREGSLALGATKAETLWRTVLPMATPAMMTGLILAVARAAGEVAPLMMVGVVKLAPSLPVDGNFPYLHLDRKFMHLGFHIYDVGFQSPNVEAARPLVYATALLLIIITVALNLAAIRIRNRLREKYNAGES